MPTSPTQPVRLADLKLAQEKAFVEKARRRLASFAVRLNDRLVFQKFHHEIIDALEALGRGEIENLAVFVPPRHGKSELVSINFPAWHLGRNPRDKIILASYGLDLPQKMSRQVRNKFNEPAWPFPDVTLAEDSKAVERWATNFGGEFLASATGAAITGFGADILIIDDPIKGRKAADSQIVRDDCWDWYLEDASTRLMPGGRTLLCQTRWHEDDLAGRILNEPGALNDWEVICLPALAQADDPIGRKPGEALDPNRYPREALLRIQKRIKERGWNALYQQRPGSAKGNIFEKSWWRTYNLQELVREGLKASCITVDPNIEGGSDNDYAAIAVWGWHQGQFYLMDLWAEQIPFYQLREVISGFYERWKVPVVIEDIGPGKILIQQFRNSSSVNERISQIMTVPWKLHSTNTDGSKKLKSKTERAKTVTDVIEGGLVWIPSSHEYLDLWMQQHTDFPTALHDDFVDTTVMGLNRLSSHMESFYDMLGQEFSVSYG